MPKFQALAHFDKWVILISHKKFTTHDDVLATPTWQKKLKCCWQWGLPSVRLPNGRFSSTPREWVKRADCCPPGTHDTCELSGVTVSMNDYTPFVGYQEAVVNKKEYDLHVMFMGDGERARAMNECEIGDCVCVAGHLRARLAHNASRNGIQQYLFADVEAARRTTMEEMKLLMLPEWAKAVKATPREIELVRQK